MQHGKASQTAAWVAGARTLGQLLPVAQRLADDPYGMSFVGGPVRRLGELLLAHPALFQAAFRRVPALRAFLWWMQLRTRAYDDVLRAFVRAGGRQVVLLGAGYDCRALRFSDSLREVTFVEVDHPSTQAHKRAVLEAAALRSSARYVAWDFERDVLSALPERLRDEGLRADAPTLTFWEGVTMYLSEIAIDATFEAVRRFGAPGSQLCFNYIDRKALSRPRGDQTLTQWLARSVGEPHRFGWDPPGLGAWLEVRGYVLRSDDTDRALAERFLGHDASQAFAAENRHIALVETRARA